MKTCHGVKPDLSLRLVFSGQDAHGRAHGDNAEESLGHEAGHADAKAVRRPLKAGFHPMDELKGPE